MLKVTIHEAKTHLSRLIRRVLAGEEVVIARGREPVAKLVSMPRADSGRVLGDYAGRIRIAADFDAPLADFEPYG